ncbi:MAG: beta-ketoacyl-[acyl-carrier-protein] synthase II [Chloroflexi bacterium RBG_16_58_14]|nr:MAG: beta-ketoacyl-[acyl-carrier-protein] synthase II [Chloroflexi bacterium RBG_16_58_14]
MEDRIVVSGLGAISSIGHSAAESWRNALEGVSGVGPISLFDASALPVRFACEVKNFKPEEFMPAKDARRRDRFEQLATAAAKEAILHAGLNLDQVDRWRVGVFISTAIGGLGTLQDGVRLYDREGARKISPFTVAMMMSNGAAGLVSIDYGFRGPSSCIASACASGADGIGTAWMWLRSGLIDVAVAGASDATINEIGVAALERSGAMSNRNDGYQMTPQPFDLNRDGLVMGEGAAILVLETESHARRRGVNILAELAGYGASADGFHITAPLEDGAGGTRAIFQALAAARINPDEVSYINAHGTGTVLNDAAETRAIKAAFGDLAYNIPVSSTKSMTGHMMGATGALEAVFCVRAVQQDAVPPTIHYQTPDPACDLDYVPNQARELTVEVAVSNAFGFGGHNAVLVFRKYR